MGYLEDFRGRVHGREYNKVLVLWQEYCESDDIDADEVKGILTLIKQSDFAQDFGYYVEAIIPLVMKLPDLDQRLEVLCVIYDLQTSNSQGLWDLAIDIVTSNFANSFKFQDKLRLVGLRTRGDFQGALSNFFLLNHVSPDHYVFHNAGWGVGKVVECSFLREQISVAFANLHGSKKDISFKSAFKSLVPLRHDDIRVLRVSSPELVARQAKEDGVALVVKILKDMGPQTAADIKEFLVPDIFDVAAYTKWWQMVRTKMKKDGRISMPTNTKELFALRKATLSLETRLEESCLHKETASEIIGVIYTFSRDFSSQHRSDQMQKLLLQKATSVLQIQHSIVEELQVHFLVEHISGEVSDRIKEIVLSIKEWEHILPAIEIIAFRKRALQAIAQFQPAWRDIFCSVLSIAEPAQIKDYILKELADEQGMPVVIPCIEAMVQNPAGCPETLVWYCIRAFDGEAPYLTDQQGKERLLESLLLVLSSIEHERRWRELVKKIVSVLTGNRYKLIREILEFSSRAYAPEGVLVASKCSSLKSQEQSVLKSLVEVVHGGPAKEVFEEEIIWTTQEGYLRAKEQICHLGTVEVVENAKEIETARAHGDLRENSEYKYALEKRARIQNDLTLLSEQFHRARIITSQDVSTACVGVGTKVTLSGSEPVTMILLGPWDADPEKNIFSLHSKIAQSMLGKKVGDQTVFKGQTMHIVAIENALA